MPFAANYDTRKAYAHLKVEELLGYRLLELIGLLALRLNDLCCASEHGAFNDSGMSTAGRAR